MASFRIIFLSFYFSEAVTQNIFFYMKKNAFLVAALLYCSHLSAQDSSRTKSLDVVVVTAARIEQKQSQTGKVISVIDRATLERNADKTVGEILNQQTGIFIVGSNNALGTNQDLYFRGASTGNTLFLIDGVPVGDASLINNSFDINSLNAYQIERIEILKGAQSTLWGSDAVAGVINIITKKAGAKKLGGNAGLQYGSYNTFRANAGLQGAANQFLYSAQYSFTNSKGFSSAYDSTGTKNFDKDGFDQHNLIASVGYQINPNWSIKYTSNYSKYKAGLDAGAFKDDKDYNLTATNWLNTLSSQYTGKKGSLQFQQSFNYTSRFMLDDSTNIGGFAKWAEQSYKSHSSITDLFGSLKLAPSLTLVSGVQYLAQNTDQYYKSISSFGPYNSVPLGKDSTKMSNTAVYASAIWNTKTGFNLEAGLRFNNHSIYGNNTTFSINPSFKLTDEVTALVNISSGFKTPSLYQLYSEYGNKNLKPETSNNYEFGFQYREANRKASFRMIGFVRDIKNLIIFYTDPNTYASYYINRDKQHDYGVEVESTISFGKKGFWTTNITYVDGEGVSEGTKTKNLYRRPNLSLNSQVTVMPIKNLTTMASVRFVGTRLKGPYDLGPNTMPAYYTVDLYASYKIFKYGQLFVDLKNLTNQTYFDVVGYNTRARNFMTGIQVNF